MFDLVFTPIVASHHFSQTDHMAFTFTFWAPTGSFETGRLVNLGLNNWTFNPGVAYTKILPQANIELSGIWQMEFYNRESSHQFSERHPVRPGSFGYQTIQERLRYRFRRKLDPTGHDDEGTAADSLNGFVGRAFGIGPIVTYSTKLGKSSLDFSARWIHDFDVSKRVEGDGFNFSASLKF